MLSCSALDVLQGTGMCQAAAGFWGGLGPLQPLKSLRCFPCAIHSFQDCAPIWGLSSYHRRDVSDCRWLPGERECPAMVRQGCLGLWRRRGGNEPPRAAPTFPPGSPAQRTGCLLEAHSSPCKQLAVIWVQSRHKWAPEVLEYLYKTTTLLIKTFPIIIFQSSLHPQVPPPSLRCPAMPQPLAVLSFFLSIWEVEESFPLKRAAQILLGLPTHPPSAVTQVFPPGHYPWK